MAEFHDGLDIAAEMKTEVMAVKSGVITNIGVSRTYGNTLTMTTDDGYTIKYAHLYDTLVEENQRVTKGQAVARSGNSGLTTGPHLHYSVFLNDTPIDPSAFVSLPYAY